MRCLFSLLSSLVFVTLFVCIMAPKRDLGGKDTPPGKKQTGKTIMVEQKVDIIGRYVTGESTNAIRNVLNLPESTLRTIQKDREKILVAFKAGAGGARVLSGQSTLMVHMEKMIMTWMDHRKRQGLSITFNDIKKKAMECCEFLNVKETGPVPEFAADTGWFYNFKASHAFRSVKRSGKAKSTDADAAALYPDELRPIIEDGGYKPEQVFDMDETGLQCKKMSQHTYITREEKCALRFKAYKDCFTLLLGANLTRDCKLKPVLVYHVENPHALRDYEKNSCPSTGTLTPVVG